MDALVPATDEVVEITLLDLDLREAKKNIDQEAARQLTKDIAYLLMYEASSEDGLPYSGESAHEILERDYAWLLEIAKWKKFTVGMVTRMATTVDEQRWNEMWEGRKQFAAKRFQVRVRELDRIIPKVVQAIQNGSLGAIAKYVQLVQLDKEIVGYGSPTKYEFSTGSGEEPLSDAERERAQAATQYALQFEQSLLPEVGSGFMQPEPDIIEGEISEADSENSSDEEE